MRKMATGWNFNGAAIPFPKVTNTGIDLFGEAKGAVFTRIWVKR
jgi:hypothetical protein